VRYRTFSLCDGRDIYPSRAWRQVDCALRLRITIHTIRADLLNTSMASAFRSIYGAPSRPRCLPYCTRSRTSIFMESEASQQAPLGPQAATVNNMIARMHSRCLCSAEPGRVSVIWVTGIQYRLDPSDSPESRIQAIVPVDLSCDPRERYISDSTNRDRSGRDLIECVPFQR
jgi:hypothetical protein